MTLRLITGTNEIGHPKKHFRQWNEGEFFFEHLQGDTLKGNGSRILEISGKPRTLLVMRREVPELVKSFERSTKSLTDSAIK